MPKYNVRPVEQRGYTREYYEPRPVVSFWKEFDMDTVMQWTAEELESKIDAYLDAYQERQLKINQNWWYPEFRRDLKRKKKKLLTEE